MNRVPHALDDIGNAVSVEIAHGYRADATAGLGQEAERNGCPEISVSDSEAKILPNQKIDMPIDIKIRFGFLWL